MPSLKHRVKISSEPTTISQWDDQKIKLSLDPTNHSGELLSQDLLSASHDLYQTKALHDLGLMQHSYFDEETKLLMKSKKDVSPNSTRRFIVDIGCNKFHEQNFNLRKCPKSDDEDHKTFRSMLENHYLWCFSADEQTYIQKALERSNTQHVVIYNRYFRLLSRNKKEVEPIYFVAAAATFIISKTCSVLMYMGVADEFFVPKSDFNNKKNDISNDSKKGYKQENYRNRDLGAYMISMVQKMTYCAINCHTIIAQVYNHCDKGAVYFYLKQYFAIVNRDHYQVHESRRKFPGIYQDAPGLVYMISRCPLYTVFPNFMNNLSNIDYMNDAINHGVENILKIPYGNQSIIYTDVSEEFDKCSSHLQNKNEAFFCKINNNETKNLLVSNEKVSNQNEEDSILIPNENFWNIFLKPEGLKLLGSESENISTKANHNYRMMALLLFKDEQRFSDVRCFFYYIMQCLEFLSLEKCPLFDFELKSSTKKNLNDNVIIFQKNLLYAILKCEEIFGYDELKKHNLPGVRDNPLNNATPEDMYNAVRYIKSKQLCPSYPATQFEWSLFSSIFNIDIMVFHAFSWEKQGLNDNDERQWIVKENKKNQFQ